MTQPARPLGQLGGVDAADPIAPRGYPGERGDLICPDCGAMMSLHCNRYGRPYYRCAFYPVCRATCSAHHQTGAPIAVPANLRTRRARQRAHAALDALFRHGATLKEQQALRARAYAWLAFQLGLKEEECHIGLFDEQRCRQALQLCLTLKLKHGGLPR